MGNDQTACLAEAHWFAAEEHSHAQQVSSEPIARTRKSNKND